MNSENRLKLINYTFSITKQKNWLNWHQLFRYFWHYVLYLLDGEHLCLLWNSLIDLIFHICQIQYLKDIFPHSVKLEQCGFLSVTGASPCSHNSLWQYATQSSDYSERWCRSLCLRENIITVGQKYFTTTYGTFHGSVLPLQPTPVVSIESLWISPLLQTETRNASIF